MTGIDLTKPLGEEDLRRINEALASLDAAERAATLAERAGIDVSSSRTAIRDVRGRLVQVKQVYFPNR